MANTTEPAQSQARAEPLRIRGVWRRLVVCAWVAINAVLVVLGCDRLRLMLMPWWLPPGLMSADWFRTLLVVLLAAVCAASITIPLKLIFGSTG